MVTNAGATTGQNNVKENGNSAQDKDGQSKDDYSNLKRSEVTKSADKTQDQHDSGGVQNEAERAKYIQPPGTNGLPPSAYQGRPYSSNGVPQAGVNGPQGPTSSAPGYPPYSYNHTAYPGKPGLRTMGPGYPNHMQRYATPHPGGTPTLNQLLTTPSKYPAQYPGYHPSSQQDYQPQSWPGRPSHFPRPMDPSKPADMQAYPQQYMHEQAGYTGQPRYPHVAPPGAQSPHSQQYNSTMPPPGGAGYQGHPASHPTGPSGPSRHPGYHPAYPNYYRHNHTGSYHTPSQAPTDDPKTYEQRPMDPQQNPTPSRTPDSTSSGHSRITEQHIMSPNRKTPQPPNHQEGATPSPQVHHPSVAQLRGPSAPGSPASSGNPRSNPLSPPVRPGTPHQGLRPEHPDPSMPNHSPMPGYGHYRPLTPQTSQHGYGPQNPGPPNYPQHMMSPQQYPGGQGYPSTPQQPHGPPMRPAGPPSGGKPGQMMSPQGYPQTQQSPAYQGVPPYYGSTHPYPMQGYGTSSPAPSERRPSRQGSHPSAQQTDPGGRQGAAAAAAAAMVAAAHSAQPMTPQAAPRNPTPSYYPPSNPQTTRPQYNMQGGEMYPQSMGFPRMPHPGVQGGSPGQRMMGPPHPSQRMPSAPYGYPQQPNHPQYSGYYPPNSGEAPHPHGYPQNSYETPPPSAEETPKPKSSARSASQKLAALFEPSDEPGRREFIESVLRYWEDKELPLKNAPLMGRKTLDLFHLYLKVKDRGGMQEVTSGKKWAEISTDMGLGTSSTSGFTLKKQYCKYLYGYECRVERGQDEPHEALARILEANRKRKVPVDSQASKDETKPASTTQGNPPAPRGVPPTQTRYPSQQYPQYPNQIGSYPPPPPQGYMQGHPSAPPYQYPPQMPPPQNTPAMQTYPPMQPPGPNFPPTSSYPKIDLISTPPLAPDNPPPAKAGTEAPTDPTSETPNPPAHPPSTKPQETNSVPPYTEPSKPPQQPAPLLQPPGAMPQSSVPMTQPPNSIPHSAPNSMTQPPVSQPHSTLPQFPNTMPPHSAPPSSMQPPNSVSQPTNSLPPSTNPLPHPPSTIPQPSNPPHPTNMMPQQYRPTYPSGPHQQYPHHPPRPHLPHQDHYRTGVRPGIPQTNYPYSNSPSVHRPGSVPSQPGSSPYHPQAPSPRNSPYPSNMGQPPTSRPTYPSQGYPGHPYTSSSQYLGMKRPATDPYGPPSKYIRPEGHSYSTPGGYPPNHPQFDRTRPRYPASSTPHHPMYMRRDRGPLPPGSYPKHEGPRWSHPGVTQQAQSPVQFQHIQKYSMDQKKSRHVFRSSIMRSDPMFPADSVEATQPRYVRNQRKTCRDVGVLEGWKIIMALKSGLLVESTWALNVLTVLLYDQQTVAQFKLMQLPGLLDALVEHYRRCLSSIFTLSSEQKSMGVDGIDPPEPEEDAFQDDIIIEPATSKIKTNGKKKKGSKLLGVFPDLPIKIEPRTDPFVVDRSHQWDFADQVDLSDDLSHIVVSFEQSTERDRVEEDEITDAEQPMMVVEATLEDVLSIPSFVLAPDEDDDVVTDDVTANDVTPAAVTADDVTTHDVAKNEKPPQKSDEISKNEKVPEILVSTEVKQEKPDCEVTEKRDETTNDTVNDQSDVTNPDKPAEIKEPEKSIKDDKTELKRNIALCNGLQTNLILNREDVKPATSTNIGTSPKLSLTSRVGRILEERNVVLLEDEAAGINGSQIDLMLGPVLRKKVCKRQSEVAERLECISNIIRSLSFVPVNSVELCRQRGLMRAISGTLLLRHKHRTRPRHAPTHTDNGDCCEGSENVENDVKTELQSEKMPYYLNSLSFPGKKSIKSELFAPVENTEQKRRLFSATVLDDNDNTELYNAPWWWDTVRRIREDSLVIFANIAHTIDLSELPDDHVAMAMLEACLHWSVCPSSEAADPFSSSRSRRSVSPQRLALEILTKLSIKDQNVDLILATRPFSRIEKLFAYLVNLICDRKDQMLREFAVVLLANLAGGDYVAARAIALHKGAISGLISFLEECEETGMSHRRMFPAVQQTVNFGTIEFMMVKCATTLLCLARLDDNRSSFVKFQLRLLSLSMSQLLDQKVVGIMSSVLYELSHDSS